MKKLFMWTFILNLFGCATPQANTNSDKIPLEKIEEMFSNMKASGVNTDEVMLWGYFFTSNAKNNFDKVADELKNENFDFVEVFQADDKSYWLHLERKEIHNANTLFKLDEYLYQIADKYEITYDGFDVGNTDKNKAIERDTYAIPEEYKTLDYQKDNLPCLLIGNIAFEHFPHKEEFKFFIKITTHYKTNDEVMLPSNTELENLNSFEDFIENNLTQNQIKNYYVFRETHKGIRSIYFVTNNETGAKEVLKLIKESKTQRSFEFEVLTDPNWNTYKEFRDKLETK